MKMHKAVPMFILFLTGTTSSLEETSTSSLEETSTSSHSFIPGSKVTQAPESETIPNKNHSVPERLPTIVAGISISLLLIFLLVIIGVWYARRRSKGSSAEINSVLSGEPGVSLKKMSTHENQHEWPFERAL